MFVAKSKAGDQMPTCLNSGLMVLMWLHQKGKIAGSAFSDFREY